MTIEAAPNGQEQTLSPIDENRRQVELVIETECATWQAAIEAGDGSVIHHEAEIQLLVGTKETRGMNERISYLVSVHNVVEPIDPQFVYEVMDYLKATDYDSSHSDISASSQAETDHMDEALARLIERNRSLSEAA
jgi:hypothetical protein